MAYFRQPNLVLAGRAISQNPGPTPITPAGIIPVTLDVDVATTTSLGVVQIGYGLQIDEFGVLSTEDKHEDCNSITMITDADAPYENCYINVEITHNATLTLPKDPQNCIKYIIKLNYGAPTGNRKLTIMPSGSNTIDGLGVMTLTTPYQCLKLISYKKNWHII